jgi:F-type H+-transporting ATPase subunit delta
MAELATIARPYAEALFQAAHADLNTASLWIDELSEIAKNAELQQLADNPNVTVQQVFDLVIGIATKAAQSDQAKNLLLTVLQNGRLSALPEIAVQFRDLKNAQSGFSDAVIHSAFEIDAPALVDLGAYLESKFRRKLNLSVVVNAELIGGVRVVVGDEVLDTSVKARLEHMKAALIV